MSYCPDCGIELGDAPLCPLCGTRNPRIPEKEKPECEEEQLESPADFLGATPAASAQITPQEGRKIAWEVISVAFAIAIIVPIAINLLVLGKLTWALYPASAFIFLWMCATSLLALYRKPRQAIALVFLAIPLFLLSLGAMTGDISWAWRLAVPIAIFAEMVITGVGLMILTVKRKGLNVFSFFLVGIAVLCVGIEIFIDLFALGTLGLGWSVINAMALIPIAGFLLYLHYRVAKSTNLRRLFRL